MVGIAPEHSEESLCKLPLRRIHRPRKCSMAEPVSGSRYASNLLELMEGQIGFEQARLGWEANSGSSCLSELAPAGKQWL